VATTKRDPVYFFFGGDNLLERATHLDKSSETSPALLTQNKMRTMFSLRSMTQGRNIMVRAVAEEALALASMALFLGMVAVWVQVLGVV
jgi:hypothetical protein